MKIYILKGIFWLLAYLWECWGWSRREKAWTDQREMTWKFLGSRSTDLSFSDTCTREDVTESTGNLAKLPPHRWCPGEWKARPRSRGRYAQAPGRWPRWAGWTSSCPCRTEENASPALRDGKGRELLPKACRSMSLTQVLTKLTKFTGLRCSHLHKDNRLLLPIGRRVEHNDLSL